MFKIRKEINKIFHTVRCFHNSDVFFLSVFKNKAKKTYHSACENKSHSECMVILSFSFSER